MKMNINKAPRTLLGKIGIVSLALAVGFIVLVVIIKKDSKSENIDYDRPADNELLSETTFTHPDLYIRETELCTSAPKTGEDGKLIFPSSPEYGHLTFLAELFTAAGCSRERVEELPTVSDGIYAIGPIVVLNQNPSADLISTLKKSGYTCFDDNAEECGTWQLKSNSSVFDTLSLRSYASEIKADLCISCS